VKNNETIYFAAFLFIAIAATIFLLSLEGSYTLTGASPTRTGKGVITFKNVLCGNNITDLGEDCDPPGSLCPNGLACTADCECPQPPPPPGGGGAGGAQAQCCNYVEFAGMEFECDCTLLDRGLIRIQPYMCCKNPLDLACFDFCKPLQRPQIVKTPEGICPIELTCGLLCCETDQYCSNGKCRSKESMLLELPPPPEIEAPHMITIPYTEYAFPWWYFVLGIIILLFLAYLLLRKKKRQEPAPIIIPEQKPRRRKKK
jgi:LPXTG-motif cell wall-anchored protein